MELDTPTQMEQAIHLQPTKHFMHNGVQLLLLTLFHSLEIMPMAEQHLLKQQAQQLH